MSYVKRIATSLLERRSSYERNIQALDAPLTASIFGSPLTKSSQDVTPETAMRVSAVYACVKRISETIAMMPLSVMIRTENGGNRVAGNHPFHAPLATRPNTWQTSYDWRLMMQTSLLLRGNAYSRIIRRPGRASNQLVPMHPDSVWPFCIAPDGTKTYLDAYSHPPAAGSVIWYEHIDHTGRRQVYHADEVLHRRGMSHNGVIGLGPIALHRESVGLAMATEEHGARLFSNGAQIGKILRHPGVLGDQAHDRLKKSLAQEYSGVHNAHKTMILEEGMDVSNITMTSEDAQFIETRGFQIEDIARIFGVPLILLGHSGDKNSTYASAEQFKNAYFTYTVLPEIRAWEQALGSALLYESEQSSYFIDFDESELLRGDTETRAKYYQSLFSMGSLSPDEIRRLEGLSPIDDGSGTRYYIMTTLIPSTMIEEFHAKKDTGQQAGQSEVTQ